MGTERTSHFKKGLTPPKGPGRKSMKSPKSCLQCGGQGENKDSVKYDDYVRRRYSCICGNRWTTYEVRLTDEDLAE